MDEKDADFTYADDDVPSLHETSFNTASDGYAERFETDTQGTSVDGDPSHSDNRDGIRSSRQMPVPEYLERRENNALLQARQPTASDPTEDEAPPPTYDEVMKSYPKPARLMHPHSGPSRNFNHPPEPTENSPEPSRHIRPHPEPSRGDRRDPEPSRGDRRHPEPSRGDRRDPEPSRDLHPQPEPTETDLMNDRDGGAGEASDDGLSPAEIALVMRMREGRDDYLPERRNSYEEALEMLGPDRNNSALATIEVQPEEVDTHLDTVDTYRNGERSSRRLSHNVEAGTPEPRKSNRLLDYLQRQPPERLLLIGVLVLAVVGFVLFLGLFPASFVYVEYHEVALKQSKMTNVVDRDEVFYHGCYVLGPDTQFVRFQASVHNVVDEMRVFTLDTIQITMRYSAHYFIRPKEVGELYTMFVKDYDPVFRKIITSSIRNLAGTTFTVDNFRFNRTYIEREIHVMLRKRLGGDCCPACCPSSCQSNLICGQCKQADCSQGYHVDVRFFYLMDVTIPEEVFERYLRFTILEIEKEKEFFIQEHAVTTKMTKFLTDKVKNEAHEIIAEANAEKDKITVISEAEREQSVQKTYVKALQKMFTNLNVTNEDHKLSLMMVRMFEDQADNIYAGYAYDLNKLAAP